MSEKGGTAASEAVQAPAEPAQGRSLLRHTGRQPSERETVEKAWLVEVNNTSGGWTLLTAHSNKAMAADYIAACEAQWGRRSVRLRLVEETTRTKTVVTREVCSPNAELDGAGENLSNQNPHSKQ